MKSRYFKWLGMLLVASFVIVSSCEKEDDEICEADDYSCNNEEVTATYCCEGDACFYKVDGEEFDENNEEAVYDALCSVSISLKSTNNCSLDKDAVIARLKALKQSVKQQMYSSN